MIDVLLVLLIIFMLFNLLWIQHIPVQVPDPAAVGQAGPTIVLSVEPGPAYALNGRATPTTQLEDEIRAVYAERPDKILFVKGARTVRYQEVVVAFDAARGAGVHATGVVIPR